MSEIKANEKVTYTEEENKVITELYLYALETIEHLGGNVEECIDEVTDYILKRVDKWVRMNSTDSKFAVYQFVYRKIKYSKETVNEELSLNNVSYVHMVSTGAELLWKAVETLPEREQVIIFHRYVQDKSYSDIAEILGISASRVSQIDHRALRHLRMPYRLGMFVDIEGLRRHESGYHCVPMIML